MKKTILIVDDDDNIRNNYKDVLEDEGFHVVEYNSVDNWHAKPCAAVFDLAILDITLNGDRYAGHQLCDLLKSRYPGMPVVMLTSLDDQKNRKTAIDNGADGYWIKSACLDDFVNHVRSVLEKRVG